jgi:hypothetical protein
LNGNIPQRMRHTLLALCTFFLIAARGQDTVDATSLVFMIHHDSITIRVNHWSLTTLDTAELNRFVDQHIRSIDPNKIIVYGDAAAEYPAFKPIIDVLKKHDWLKFKLQPTGPATKASPPKNSRYYQFRLKVPKVIAVHDSYVWRNHCLRIYRS